LTPLHYAATSGNEAIIDLLLMRGADVTQKDNDGQTPADCADAAHIREKLEMHRSLVMQSVQENNEMEKEKEPKGAESQSENDDEEEKQDS
jgi:ankyrin repeat protein